MCKPFDYSAFYFNIKWQVTLFAAVEDGGIKMFASADFKWTDLFLINALAEFMYSDNHLLPMEK